MTVILRTHPRSSGSLALAAGAVVFCLASAVRAEQPAARFAPELVQQAHSMIQALASDSYSTRVQARQALLQLGRAAIEPLEHAAQSEDPEVRTRAIEILIALRGRGFLGIGLQESGDEDAPPPSDAAGVVPPTTVIANQIVPHVQYAAYGVVKPFPAELAGLQPGDKLLAVNDRPVHGVKDLMREVITIGPGRTAIITVERAGKRMRVPVTLTRNPILSKNNGFEFMIIRDPPPPVDLEKEQDNSAPAVRAQAAATPRKQAGAVSSVKIVSGLPDDIPPAIAAQIQQALLEKIQADTQKK